MEPDIKAELAEIKEGVRKIRSYMRWTFIITVIVVVLPIIGLFVALPSFLGTFSELKNLGL